MPQANCRDLDAKASAALHHEPVTILIRDWAADDYANRLSQRFPQLRVLCASDAEVLEHHLPEADILLASNFPASLLHRAGRLKWFHCTNAGVDSLLAVRSQLGGLLVTNARGIQGELIADFVIGGITMLHWDFPRFMREQSQREWHPREVGPLAERTLGVVGLGSIGAAVARRAKGAGLTVLGTKRDVTQPVVGVDKLLPAEGLVEVLESSDFVVLAVPLLPDTERLIGREELRRMRRSAFLVNIARGRVVDEAELIGALRTGIIAGALLDVFEQEPPGADSPLWSLPNLLMTPHVAGWPSDYSRRVFEVFGDNLKRFLDGRPLRNVVDVQRGY